KVRLPSARAERRVGNDAANSRRISPRPFAIRQRQRGLFPMETPTTFKNLRLAASTGARDRRLHQRLIGLEREAITPPALRWSSSPGQRSNTALRITPLRSSDGSLPARPPAARVLRATIFAQVRRGCDDVFQPPRDTGNAGDYSRRHFALLFGADASAEGDVPVGGGDEDLPKPGHRIREERRFRLRSQTQIPHRLPCGRAGLETLLLERMTNQSGAFVDAQAFGVDDEVVEEGIVPVHVVEGF